MKIDVSINAQKQIAGIYIHLCEKFGVRVADKRIAELYDNLYLLEKHPFMGKSCDGHDENFRLVVSAPNIIIYDVNDEVIEILHIVDARTDYVKNIL